MPSKEHWENVYTTKATDSVSWFQEHANTSLQLIERSEIPPNGKIIDVGGGASTLVDDLLAQGYSNVSVLDLSLAALQAAQSRLSVQAGRVTWITGDITRVELPENYYNLWHDRAVFHFLVDAEDRAAYKNTLHRSVKRGGHVIVATFAEDGPMKCSGLPINRYSVADLQQELGDGLSLLGAVREQHLTPSGAIQNFNYCYFKKSQ
jgi:ubiquinone/menaquinone biosynthesis C-methylase UbiE